MDTDEITEGEWKAVESSGIYGVPHLFQIQWSKDGECVAEIVHGEANATLLAAAKDLLEALRPFANYQCSPPGQCECHNCKARDAVAKAEATPASIRRRQIAALTNSPA